MRRLAILLVTVLTALAPACLRAQDAPAPARQPGSELTVYLATMGPGAAVWEKFGHNAIWVHDASTGSTTSYDYGRFSFDQPGFVPRFLRGLMEYTMGVEDAERLAQHYVAQNRTLWVQRLNLTPQQRYDLREALDLNYMDPEYRYDYFRDNCSTRLRDMLDRALGGAIAQSLVGRPTGSTYRSHSLRLTASEPLTYTGIDLGLGSHTDRELDAWEDSFVPMQLMEHLRTIQVPGADGTMIPLVAEEQVPFTSSLPLPPAEPPARTVWYLAIGMLVAGVLLTLARRAPDSDRTRVLLGLLISFWGVVSGLLGVVLALLLLTDHTAAHRNLNLLQVNPIALLLAVVAPLALLAGQRFPRAVRLAWPAALALAGLSVTGVLLHAVPGLEQANGRIIALVLPIHLAVVLCLYRLLGTEPSPIEDASPLSAVPNAA